MRSLKLQSDGYKSVARIRLVKAENPGVCVCACVCATLKCKVCGNSGNIIVACISVLNTFLINPIIQCIKPSHK
jgi:hypothetical protein